MATYFHQFDFQRTGGYSLHPAPIRDRLIAQLIDGIFLGAFCGLTFFLFSGGKLHSIWVSPMIPQYLLEVEAGYLAGPFAFLWGGEYFPLNIYAGKTLYLAYPAPLVWIYYGLYYTLFTAFKGQTPGKMIKKLVILDIHQNQPTLYKSFLRWAGYVVSLLPLGLGFWWANSNERRQGWHDFLAATMVYSFEKS